ncbi:hypothetical protein PENVUL_c023G01508, partial [Penicillium vulpinum]
ALVIVDWELSGWLPEHQETHKTELTVDDEQWLEYLPLILAQHESTVEAWWWYMASLGVQLTASPEATII